jgi:microcystin-dependent protein
MATLVSGINVANGTVITPTILNAAPTLTPGTVAPTDLTTGGPSWDSSGNQTIGGLLKGGSPTGILSVPTGVVMPFAYSFTQSGAPAGWLICDGSFYSTTTYAALYALIGTLYGSGSGTFAVPDLRASFVRGAGSDGVATAGTFGAKQTDMAGPHNHAITDPGHNHAITDPGHAHNSTAWNLYGGGANHSPRWWYQGGNGTALDSDDVLLSTSTSVTGISVNSNTTGITINNNSGTETRPRNIAMLYCIKA